MTDLPDDEYEERVERAKLARKEARETISEQTDTISDIDEKAIKIFRINIIVASILASGVSIAISADYTTYDTLINPYTKAGSAFLFISIIAASITYTSTSERIGIAKDTIKDSILNLDYDYDLVEEEIALAYGNMIQYNFKKNATNVLYFTLTLLTAVASIIYYTAGIVDIYNSIPNHLAVNALIFVFFIGFGKASGLYGTIIRWWQLTKPPKRAKAWGEDWVESINNLGRKDS